jgi:hypothetical protein
MLEIIKLALDFLKYRELSSLTNEINQPSCGN